MRLQDTPRLWTKAVWCISFLLLSAAARGQQVVYEAAQAFPASTVSMEYENLGSLRALPDFESLRKKYLSKRMQDLQASFEGFGMRPEEVTEVVIGSRAAGSLFGTFSGTYETKKLVKALRQRGNLVRAKSSETPIYCLPTASGGLCLTLLENGIGLFGGFERLHAMLQVREGKKAGVRSKPIFASLIDSVQAGYPLWGISEGRRLRGYAQAVLSESDAPLNFSNLSNGIEAFRYGVQPNRETHLDLAFACASETSALVIGQMLTAFRTYESMLETMASSRTPSRKDRFRNVEVERSGTLVTLQMDATSPLA